MAETRQQNNALWRKTANKTMPWRKPANKTMLWRKTANKTMPWLKTTDKPTKGEDRADESVIKKG